MYYIDTNVLIYLNDIESPYHQSASSIFYHLLEKNKVILHEIVLTEFFAIVTGLIDLSVGSTVALSGITYAAIMIKTLKELDKKFSVKIVKNLERDLIYSKGIAGL